MFKVLDSASNATVSSFQAVEEVAGLAVDTVKVARKVVIRTEGLIDKAFDALERELVEEASK